MGGEEDDASVARAAGAGASARPPRGATTSLAGPWRRLPRRAQRGWGTPAARTPRWRGGEALRHSGNPHSTRGGEATGAEAPGAASGRYRSSRFIGGTRGMSALSASTSAAAPPRHSTATITTGVRLPPPARARRRGSDVSDVEARYQRRHKPLCGCGRIQPQQALLDEVEATKGHYFGCPLPPLLQVLLRSEKQSICAK